MSAQIDARGVGVQFHFDRQRRVLSPTLARFRRGGPAPWALRGVDLLAGPGDGIALVGPTGSGKTTLLRLLGGILAADEGSLSVRGKVGTLLSPAAGLLGLLTGSENAELLGVLVGMSPQQARAAVAPIKQVSGLGDSFELPVSSYSEGMRARLGFAVAAQRDVDLLLLDEVHEALDHEFRAAVAERARAVRERGGIVIAAGHDHAVLETLCDRAVWLESGGVERDGEFHDVVDTYVKP
ncbi:MAG TPA: ATP-binding cassette domain-containing protein [Thermoleophilaceae bacterium]|nr:ATP-binding cassette domain-containing protein [Thermoleophilaceae bacterium]